jgi:hypothetical protein
LLLSKPSLAKMSAISSQSACKKASIRNADRKRPFRKGLWDWHTKKR